MQGSGYWSRLKSGGLIVAGAASVLAFVASFCPWYGVSYASRRQTYHLSFTAWHTYSTVAVILNVGAGAFAALAFVNHRRSRQNAIYLGMAALAFSIASLGLEVLKISTLTTERAGNVTIGFQWGAHLLVTAMVASLLACLIAVVAAPRLPES